MQKKRLIMEKFWKEWKHLCVSAAISAVLLVILAAVNVHFCDGSRNMLLILFLTVFLYVIETYHYRMSNLGIEREKQRRKEQKLNSTEQETEEELERLRENKKKIYFYFIPVGVAALFYLL